MFLMTPHGDPHLLIHFVGETKSSMGIWCINLDIAAHGDPRLLIHFRCETTRMGLCTIRDVSPHGDLRLLIQKLRILSIPTTWTTGDEISVGGYDKQGTEQEVFIQDYVGINDCRHYIVLDCNQAPVLFIGTLWQSKEQIRIVRVLWMSWKLIETTSTSEPARSTDPRRKRGCWLFVTK